MTRPKGPASSIPYVVPGTYLFRFLDPRAPHFWDTVANMLSEHKLFLNSRTNFNDPYDSRPILQDDLTNSQIREYVKEMLANPYNPKRTPSQMMRIANLASSGKTHLGKGAIQSIRAQLLSDADKFLDSGGLLSFSLTAENPLLWGHYAASFSGVCTVFRRSTSTDSAFSVCAKVRYVEKRSQLALSLLHALAQARTSGGQYDDLAEEIFFQSFLHKSDQWTYEREARIFHPFHAFKKLPFESDELLGFILGPKSSTTLEEKLRSEIKSRRPSVSIHKSSLSPLEFKIVIPHQFIKQDRRSA